MRSESGVALYSRKVLIQQQAAGLLPPWLRFLRGAVDCEDVPLNIGPCNTTFIFRTQTVEARTLFRSTRSLSKHAIN